MCIRTQKYCRTKEPDTKQTEVQISDQWKTQTEHPTSRNILTYQHMPQGHSWTDTHNKARTKNTNKTPSCIYSPFVHRGRKRKRADVSSHQAFPFLSTCFNKQRFLTKVRNNDHQFHQFLQKRVCVLQKPCVNKYIYIHIRINIKKKCLSC